MSIARISIILAVLLGFMFWFFQRSMNELRNDGANPVSQDQEVGESVQDPASTIAQPTPEESLKEKLPEDPLESFGKKPILEVDPIGQKFARLFRLTKEIASNPQALQKQQAYLQELKSSPSYINDLQSLYQRIKNSPGLEAEISGLLLLMQEASLSPGTQLKRETVNQIAENEMLSRQTKPEVIPSDSQSPADQSLILPVVAHQIFLSTTENDRVRFNGTLNALKLQGNQGVRDAIFEAYAGTNPERRQELLGELEKLKIQVSVPQ